MFNSYDCYITVIETKKKKKGHKCILCEGFRYRLDLETELGELFWRHPDKGCKPRVQTEVGLTLVHVRNNISFKRLFFFAQMSILFVRFRSFGLFFFRSNVHLFFLDFALLGHFSFAQMSTFFALLGCHFAQMSFTEL